MANPFCKAGMPNIAIMLDQPIGCDMHFNATTYVCKCLISKLDNIIVVGNKRHGSRTCDLTRRLSKQLPFDVHLNSALG